MKAKFKGNYAKYIKEIKKEIKELEDMVKDHEITISDYVIFNNKAAEQIKELKEVCYDYKRQVIQDGEQIKELKDGSYFKHLQKEIEEAQMSVEQYKKQIKQLEEYADHWRDCDKVALADETRDCSCGFDKVNKHK